MKAPYRKRQVSFILIIFCLFPNCLSSHIFCKCFEFCRPLTTSPISGAAISNKSSPILLAAGTMFFSKRGFQFYQRFKQKLQILFHVALHVLEKMRNQLNYEQPFRMKFKSKRIIQNLAEQENNSGSEFFLMYYLLVLP